MTGKVRIILAFSLSMLVLALVGFYAYKTARDYKNASEWVSHTQEVITGAQDILTDIQGIETAQRGYVITGDTGYLEPYKEGTENISGSYQHLRELTRDNPEQRRLIDSMVKATNIKLAFAKDVVETRTYSGFGAAQDMVVSGVGERMMGRVRFFNGAFIDNEKKMLASRLSTAQENFTSAQNTIIASIMLALGIIACALYFFIKDYNLRVRSERKVVESESRTKKFLETLSVGVFVLNAKGEPYYANSKATEILGKGIVPEAGRGNLSKVYKTYVAGTDRLYPSADLTRVLSGAESVYTEEMEVERDNVRVPLRMRATPVYNSKMRVEYIIAVFEDITEMRENQNKLVEAKKIAEESMALKEAFLANMSHEIRTPMNAIIGFTNLLLKRNLAGEEKGYVNTIKTSGENLLRIINDVLDVSKMESGMMTFEKHAISVSEIFSSLQAMLSSKAQEKNISLSFTCGPDIPASVLGDPTRLTQVLVNLAGNAIKFTERGSVEVFARLLADHGTTCEIEFSVKDSGIGIAEDKLLKIFDRFTQAESHTARHYGGTGLGLSIARQLVELQGGTVSVKSTEGLGSVFTFTLPFVRTSAAAKGHGKQAFDLDPRELARKKILLVEDNPVNVKFVQTLFGEYNITTDLAANGVEAVDQVRKNAYDIVLMDVEMPGMNGYEATAAIRNELRSAVPILAMTAHAMAGEREKCLQAGMNGYISKPINEGMLFREMFKLTALKQSTTDTRVTNLDYLVKAMRGNKDSIRGTLDIFLEQMPLDMESLRLAVENKDFDRIRSSAHRIKSTVSIAGANEIAKVLGELEELAVARDTDGIIERHKMIVPMTGQAVHEIEAERTKYNQ